MENPDTFDLLPVTVDPQTKAVSSTDPKNTALQSEAATLTALHRTMIALDTPGNVPPPPVPVKPQRSQQITKMRDAGNAAHRKGSSAEAIRFYSLAIEMALGRPLWEPQGLVREEVAALYANRAQTYMAQSEWADAAIDAEISIEMKKQQNPKAWYRKARCLKEMGRYEEALDWLRSGLEWESEADMLTLKKDIERELEKREKAQLS